VAEPPVPIPQHEGRPLLAVFSATFLVRFAFGITVAILAAYISSQSNALDEGTVGTVGIIAALSPAGEFSTVLFAGAAADRYGRFPILFLGIGSAAVIFLLLGLTRDPTLLAAANLGYGIASGAILASSLALVADFSGLSERGFEMGRFDAMSLSGWITGFAFGLFIKGAVPNSSLGLAFLLGAAILAAGLACAVLLTRGQPARRGRAAYSFREVARHVFRRSVLLVTLPWLAIYMLIGTVLVFLASAVSGAKISTVELAALIGVGGLVLILTQPLFGRFADRFGRIRMMGVGATGFVLLMVFASLIVAFGAVLPLLIGIGASVVLTLIYGPAALAALTDLSHEVGRATTMAIYSLTISVGMFAGLIASSQLYSHLGNTGLYIFFGALAVTVAALTAARFRELGGALDRPMIPAR